MSTTHRLLTRQVRRHLRGVESGSVPGLDALLEAVSDAYSSGDEDRLMLERAMELSSHELMEANDEMRAVFDALPDEFLLLDADGKILDFKPGIDALLGRRGSPLGANISEVLCCAGVGQFREAMEQVKKQNTLVCFEFAPMVPEGAEPVYCEVRVLPLHGGKMVSLIRNISDRKLSEQRISHLAYHDSLTGLPNRLYFQERVQWGLCNAKESGSRMGMLFLDVDRFKYINDTFGHGVGDELLVVLADRLRTSVRQTDTVAGPGAIGSSVIARMGGDEFTVLLHDIVDLDAAERVCQRIMESVSKPIVLKDTEVFTSFSVGLSIFPDHGADVETLVRNADAAMYHSKASGRNTYRIYDSSMNSKAGEVMQMEAALRRAAELGQLRLVYQPIVCAASGETLSLEALLRWEHPELGVVSPGVFIPLAEESDLILEIGAFVLDQACQQLRSWIDEGFDPPKVSVNLSSRHFWRGDVVRLVEECLHRHLVPCEKLGIELTETAMVRNTELSRETIIALRGLGLSISLDDFGTGYSSLGYLKRFPVDALKIDRSFVRDIVTDEEDATLIRAIIAMAHGLGLKVVAEGVETVEQLTYLRMHGCDMIQGYLTCRPVEAAALRAFVQGQRVKAAPPARALELCG